MNRGMNRGMGLPLRQDITGLVLAGGRAVRMGGIDKGLQPFLGEPLAQRALRRLGPQVGPLILNANRHLAEYGAFGFPVCPDLSKPPPLPSPLPGETFAGPLAGMLAGLRRCETPFLVTVPCDAPHFPSDLVARLAAGLTRDQADIATAAAPEADGPLRLLRPQPVFSLVRRDLAESLAAFLAEGGRRVGAWTARHHAVLVPFADAGDDPAAFSNANTLDDLYRFETAAMRVGRD